MLLAIKINNTPHIAKTFSVNPFVTKYIPANTIRINKSPIITRVLVIYISYSLSFSNPLSIYQPIRWSNFHKKCIQDLSAIPGRNHMQQGIPRRAN